MKSLPLEIDDDLDAALERVSADQGIGKADLAREAVRLYVERKQLRKSLAGAGLEPFYEEMADEDIRLAEAGMDDYDKSLREADDADPR